MNHDELRAHAAAVALYLFWYNFGRVHQTLRPAPAMDASVADHVWGAEEIVALLAWRAWAGDRSIAALAGSSNASKQLGNQDEAKQD